MIKFNSRVVKKYTVMLGLSDKKSINLEINRETAVRTVNEICRTNDLAYSIKFQNGGYINVEGKYVDERSIEIIFIDQAPEKVMEACKKLRAAFNQECLMSTVEDVELHEVIEIND